MGPLSTRGLLTWVSFPREHRQRVEGSPIPWGGTQQRPLVPTPRPSCQLRQVAPAGSLKSLELVLTGQSSFLRAGRRGPQTAIVTPHLSSVGCTVRKQNPLLKAVILTHHGLAGKITLHLERGGRIGVLWPRLVEISPFPLFLFSFVVSSRTQETGAHIS